MRLQSLFPALGLVVFMIPPLVSRSSAAAKPKRDADDTVIHRTYLNMPSLPLSKSLTTATDVIRGTVTSATPVYPEQQLPYTLYNLEVSWNLKDVISGEQLVRIPGVSGDGGVFLVDRAPNLAIGEDVVLILRAMENKSTFEVVGLDQGVYRVGTTGAGATCVIGTDADELPFDAFADQLYSTWLTADDGQH